MTNENISKLKLLAEDTQDLNVFSAYLQDSVIVANDIKFLPKTKKLICVFNRFMWEDAENYSRARNLDFTPPAYVIVKRRNAGIEKSWVIQDLTQWLSHK